MKEDLISVIVPIYNVEKYINKCVDSIINQTYKNLEIILVDDGSPDNCPQICDEYATKDKRIKVIHKENGGLPAARNSGVKIASGEYITFVDGDDWIDINMYSNMMSKNDDYDIIRTEYIKHDGDKELFKSKLPYQEQKLFDCTKDRDELLKLLYALKIHANIVCMVVKKELINKIYPFDEKVQLGEDLLIAVSLFCNCKNILFLPEFYYYYFQNNASISLSPERSYKNIDDLLLLKEKILAILDKYHKNSNEIKTGFEKCILIKTRGLIAEKKNEKEFKNIVRYLCENSKYIDLINNLDYKKLGKNEKIWYLITKYKLVNLIVLIYKIK